jgi:hypothetical protein
VARDVADVRRARRTAWRIGPKVEPQPTTASLPPAWPIETSWSGMESATPSTLLARMSVIAWWFSGA